VDSRAVIHWPLAVQLVTALFMAWIAYKTYRWSTRRAPADLHDRQKKVFDAVLRFIAETCQAGDTNNEKLIEMMRETRDARLYFPNEVLAYIDALYKMGIDLEYANKALNNLGALPEDKRHALGEKRLGHMNDMAAQFSAAREIFEKHLKVG
jgi:hypothetical protein